MMLTGEPPFTGPNSQAIVAKVLTEQPLPIRPKRPSVPPAVEHAVLIALQKLPADRFGTAKDYADALEGKGGTYAATIAFPASRPSRLSRLSRPGLLAALALTALAAGTAGWFVSRARRAAAPVLRYVMALPEDQALATPAAIGSPFLPMDRAWCTWATARTDRSCGSATGTSCAPPRFRAPTARRFPFSPPMARMSGMSSRGTPRCGS